MRKLFFVISERNYFILKAQVNKLSLFTWLYLRKNPSKKKKHTFSILKIRILNLNEFAPNLSVQLPQETWKQVLV